MQITSQHIVHMLMNSFNQYRLYWITRCHPPLEEVSPVQYCCVRLSRLMPCLSNVDEVAKLPNFKFVKGDICSPDLVSYVLKKRKRLIPSCTSLHRYMWTTHLETPLSLLEVTYMELMCCWSLRKTAIPLLVSFMFLLMRYKEKENILKQILWKRNMCLSLLIPMLPPRLVPNF